MRIVWRIRILNPRELGDEKISLRGDLSIEGTRCLERRGLNANFGIVIVTDWNSTALSTLALEVQFSTIQIHVYPLQIAGFLQTKSCVISKSDRPWVRRHITSVRWLCWLRRFRNS
jgi:hypothetical protein